MLTVYTCHSQNARTATTSHGVVVRCPKWIQGAPSEDHEFSFSAKQLCRWRMPAR